MGVELIFEVRDGEEGGYYARSLGHGIFTEAETWEELRANVLEATSLHFEDSPVQPRAAPRVATRQSHAASTGINSSFT
jgi:predicted RNase H-like HicB family nuclease